MSKLIIRAKTFEAWMRANFEKSTLTDMIQYGCQGGFPMLTYYTDTCKLYNSFKEEIWEAVVQDAEEYGNNNPFEYMATWGGAKNVGDADQFENLMTWYMAERTAHQILDT